MEVTGKFVSAAVDLYGKLTATFLINEKETALNELNRFAQHADDELSITVKKYRKKRSLDANAMLWSCINKIAGATGQDSWDVYLMMLERYGQFTYIKVREEAVGRIKSQWRECKEVGFEEFRDGSKYIELLCYYGSSTYDSREFSILLDGVISSMKDLHLQIPATKDVQRSLEAWEANYKARTK